MATLRERILAGITLDSNGCWRWKRGVATTTGYARIQYAGRPCDVHRLAYRLWRGDIPAGLHLDHLCRVRDCVNPEHLDPVTCKENVMRSPIALGRINAAKTHCPQGHEYTDANTTVYLRRGKYPERRCRA